MSTVASVVPRYIASVAYEASKVIGTGPITFYGMLVHNSKATAQYIQLFDTIAVPADTAIPIAVFLVPGATTASLGATVHGLRFETGLCVSNSSTGPTKTIGSADCYFTFSVQ